MLKKRFLLLFFIAKAHYTLYAQCATCKAVAETSLEEGNTTIASGVNLGVLYMLSILFIIFGLFIFLVWKHRKADGSISK